MNLLKAPCPGTPVRTLRLSRQCTRYRVLPYATLPTTLDGPALADLLGLSGNSLKRYSRQIGPSHRSLNGRYIYSGVAVEAYLRRCAVEQDLLGDAPMLVCPKEAMRISGTSEKVLRRQVSSGALTVVVLSHRTTRYWSADLKGLSRPELPAVSSRKAVASLFGLHPLTIETWERKNWLRGDVRNGRFVGYSRDLLTGFLAARAAESFL